MPGGIKELHDQGHPNEEAVAVLIDATIARALLVRVGVTA
jgi:hypothetical protein